MAKKIIILGASSQNSVNMAIQCVFWFPITSGLMPQTAQSAWGGASISENTAITTGAVLEELQNFPFPLGYPTAMIEAYVLQYWANRNAQINGKGPATFAGVFNDSVSGWSA